MKEIDDGYSEKEIEDVYKCFEFEAEVSLRVRGTVYAKTEEEARELVEKKQGDEIIETTKVKVENILEIKESVE